VICGAEGPTDMETFGETKAEWLKQFLELPFGIPSHDTFGRVLSVIAPAEFERCLLKWVNTQVKLPDGEIVALDGKTLRGPHNKAKEQDAIELVSAWAAS
jgi:DDE_Tnp_1-associated